MILPRIDWAELSLQVVITFGHFLWQACFVALLLAAIDLVCSRAPAFRSCAKPRPVTGRLAPFR